MRYRTSTWWLLGLSVISACCGGPAAGDDAPAATSLLTLDRLFGAREFETESTPAVRWSKKSSTYFTLEDATAGTGRNLIRTDPVTGTAELIVAASTFTPRKAKEPLHVEEFDFSDDESRLLIYTNSKRVWRSNTRGDYWI